MRECDESRNIKIITLLNAHYNLYGPIAAGAKGLATISFVKALMLLKSKIKLLVSTTRAQ